MIMASKQQAQSAYSAFNEKSFVQKQIDEHFEDAEPETLKLILL